MQVNLNEEETQILTDCIRQFKFYLCTEFANPSKKWFDILQRLEEKLKEDPICK